MPLWDGIERAVLPLSPRTRERSAVADPLPESASVPTPTGTEAVKRSAVASIGSTPDR